MSSTSRPHLLAGLLGPTVAVTLFTLGAQAMGFLTQAVIAAAFGARADMDAFLAANTLPQYVMTVVVGTLGFVLVPVFIDYAASKRPSDAWDVASGVMTTCVAALAALAVAATIFARPLLHWTTPGLSDASLDLAVSVARVTWPAIVLSGLTNLFTSLYHAQSRFTWPSFVPMAGALVNLTLVALLARPYGVVGVAIAATAGLVMQAALLCPIVVGSGRCRPHFHWSRPGVRRVFYLLLPLVLAGLLTRWTPIIDRYLASQMPEGAISRLGYAFRLVSLVTGLLSAGVATTLFPRLAHRATAGDMHGLRGTLAMGMRLIWMVIAPVTTIAAFLALPVTTVAFHRGAFTAEDAAVVAMLFRVYLLSLGAACLGGMTGRTFYALKQTRTIAVVGVVEAVAYVIYAPMLARSFDAAGLALAYAVYFNASFLWQLVVLWFRTGRAGGRPVVESFARTGMSALAAGLTAGAVMLVVHQPVAQLVAGSVAGLLVYAACMLGMSGVDVRLLREVWASPPPEPVEPPMAPS